MADFIIKYRWWIIIFFIALSIIMGRQIPRAEIDPDMKSQIPEDMPSRVTSDHIDSLFGGSDMIMIILKTDDVLSEETLKRVKTLTKKIKRVKGVEKVLSLFELKSIKGEDGFMVVDPAVKRIPENEDEREKLRQELKENDLVYGSVVAKDFCATTVIGIVDDDADDETIYNKIKEIIAETPGSEETVIAGLPVVRTHVSEDIPSDMRRLLPLGLLIMLVFLFFSFRQLRGVLLPFIVVVMSIMFAMGLIPFFGWKIQILTILVPIMLVAVANDYGIHLIARYQELNTDDQSISKAYLSKNIFTSLAKPIILTGLTTIAGLMCLLSHIIIPAKQLGVLASFGVLYALGASLFFIPAMLYILPRAKPIFTKGNKVKKKRFLEIVLSFFGKLVSEHPKAILIVALSLSLVSAIGVFFIEIDTNPNNYYPPGNPLVHANDLANESFGGTTNISVVVSGDVKSPEIMHKIDDIEKKLHDLPEVGITTSIARVIKQMSRALNDKDEPFYDKIPDSRNAIAQYLELYTMSGDPEDFEKMVDFPYQNAQIMARIKEISTQKINYVVDYAHEITKGDHDVKYIGGFATILGEIAQMVVRGQITSLFLALIIVAIMIIIMFRSFTAGLISAIPLGLSMVVLFGLMGFARIPLNIPTAMLSSIMIGVGIDYTIHFLWRYKEERANGIEPSPAVKKTLTTTGRGIIFNAFSVIIGFAVLMSSSFMPVKFFGFLIVVSIGSCLIGALILIPSLCLVLRPKFLEPITNPKGIERE
ncbi:MMPL family transporter [bacterium]|nr:MMPL family transporter [bacterium]